MVIVKFWKIQDLTGSWDRKKIHY